MDAINSLPGIVVLIIGLCLVILSALAVAIYKTFSAKTFFYIVIVLGIIVCTWYINMQIWIKCMLTFWITFFFFLFMASGSINDDMMTDEHHGQTEKDIKKNNDRFRHLG
jgi:phosphotransferase system  glucose/maltose/N-acetylglucosamine-specific IIC component